MAHDRNDNRLDMQDINEALSRDIAETKQLLIRLRSNAGLLMAETQKKDYSKVERRCITMVADTVRLAKIWAIADQDLSIIYD